MDRWQIEVRTDGLADGQSADGSTYERTGRWTVGRWEYVWMDGRWTISRWEYVQTDWQTDSRHMEVHTDEQMDGRMDEQTVDLTDVTTKLQKAVIFLFKTYF